MTAKSAVYHAPQLSARLLSERELAPEQFCHPGSVGLDRARLPIQRTIAFKSDATYKVDLNSTHVIADKVVATGVTIDSGVHFPSLVSDKSVLTPGTVFTGHNYRLLATEPGSFFIDFPQQGERALLLTPGFDGKMQSENA